MTTHDDEATLPARDAEHPWSALVPAHALGALDGEERASFEAHLAGCGDCRAELRDYVELSHALATAAPAARPPAALRDRIMSEARAGVMQQRERHAVSPSDTMQAELAVRYADHGGVRPVTVPTPASDAQAEEQLLLQVSSGGAARRRRSRSSGSTSGGAGSRGDRGRGLLWSGWMAAAASLALAAGLGARWSTERAARIDAQRVAVDARAAIAARDSLLTAVLAPGVQMASLTSTASAPAARVFWHRTMGIVVLTAGRVQPTKPGRTYQLWGITPGKPPQSLGTFAANTSGEVRAILRVPVDAAMATTAVTEEPEGGSPLPTTQPILVGELRAE